MSLAIFSTDINNADSIGKQILEYSMKNGYYTDMISISCLGDFFDESQNRVFSTILCTVDEIRALDVVDEIRERLPQIKLAVLAGTSTVASGCFAKGVDFCAERKLDEMSIKRIVDLCFSA